MNEVAAAALLIALLRTVSPDVAVVGVPASASTAQNVTSLRGPFAATADADQPRPVVAAPDAWLGADKLQHFWMSYATTSFTFAAARAAGLDGSAALGVAVPAAAVAGLGKEFADRARGRPFSVKDLVADAAGVAAAYFLLREVR